MERIKPPQELDIESPNLADTWKEWKESWQLYKISSGLAEKKKDEITVATLQSVLGIRARRVLKTLPDIEVNATERSEDGIITALEGYCIPRKNVTYERYVFRMAVQEERPFDTYLTELRRQADLCEFGILKDSLIRDQIVIGTNNAALRERLLREADLTIEKTINSCRASEKSKEQSKVLANSAMSTVDSVKKAASFNTMRNRDTYIPQPTNDVRSSKIMNCKFCALSHDKGRCPAWGATCFSCGERNHFQKVCNRRYRREVRGIE